jgi:sulfonate transport system substrate-binding protein
MDAGFLSLSINIGELSMKHLLRSWIVRAVVSASLVAASVGASFGADNVVRIGYQKYGKLVLLKGRGTLEEKLKPLGYSVVWTEFPSGPPLLEALNVGSVDFGIAGETPPIFAQAAGAPLVYLAYDPPAPKGEAILVPKDSPLKSVADLKGKKVALNKGSNVHYLLVRALEQAGLKYTDIQTVFLAPADALAAFARGSVDAWVIWDPYEAGTRMRRRRKLPPARAFWPTAPALSPTTSSISRPKPSWPITPGQWTPCSLRSTKPTTGPRTTSRR